MARLNILVVLLGIALTCINAKEKHYSDRYDHINVLSILTNDKLRLQYYKCFIDQAPCVTGDAKFFKEIFTEALQTNCKKCTEAQQLTLEQILEWYPQNKPDEWKHILEKSLEDIKKKAADK